MAIYNKQNAVRDILKIFTAVSDGRVEMNRELCDIDFDTMNDVFNEIREAADCLLLYISVDGEFEVVPCEGDDDNV